MKNIENKNFIVLTGAPGAGKTTLLNELALNGDQVTPEPARKIIAEQRKMGGSALPEKNPQLFIEKLLSRSIEQFDSARAIHGRVYFDRGIPDVIAYAKWYELQLNEFEMACHLRRYQSQIFILPPWEKIYASDDERKMTFKESIKFHKFIEDAYQNAGYELIEVPWGSAKTRAEFVQNHLTA